jgi:serine/threonine protein kinase
MRRRPGIASRAGTTAGAGSSTEALLDRPVWEASGYSSATIDIGTQLGAYRIESVLGQGGMGVVYRALDTKLNRTVAVKLLSSDLADATAGAGSRIGELILPEGQKSHAGMLETADGRK